MLHLHLAYPSHLDLVHAPGLVANLLRLCPSRGGLPDDLVSRGPADRGDDRPVDRVYLGIESVTSSGLLGPLNGIDAALSISTEFFLSVPLTLIF